MCASIAAQSSLTGGILIAAVVIGLIELALVVVCLVDIVRRPAVLGEHKWVWVLVVVFFNLIGPIVYLAVGRVSPPPTEDTQTPTDGARDRAATAANLLYGPSRGRSSSSDGAPPPPPTV